VNSYYSFLIQREEDKKKKAEEIQAIVKEKLYRGIKLITEQCQTIEKIVVILCSDILKMSSSE
jgi:hypothetical protein